jgi:hypothetical protein
LADGNWLVVAGYFDPLTASVVERLETLVAQRSGERVFAIVLDEVGSLLSADARSTLVAALRMVDAVSVIRRQNLSTSVPPDSRIRFVFDEQAERRNLAEFSALVLGKERLTVRANELGS